MGPVGLSELFYDIKDYENFIPLPIFLCKMGGVVRKVKWSSTLLVRVGGVEPPHFVDPIL